ncbi:hypothetical protein [Sulfuriferula sp. AH1]|uniref:hypothetical protein n=1 Tax=Sulfuriferula sp. AH1 TaxID=1985873 RepID=UPI0016755C71|nr:hypothetical protein [Sulfuriferula sp. AH1]
MPSPTPGRFATLRYMEIHDYLDHGHRHRVEIGGFHTLPLLSLTSSCLEQNRLFAVSIDLYDE